ncbi:hypothetical protein PanWU01x14_058700, partial [Parasponia andersonii]
VLNPGPVEPVDSMEKAKTGIGRGKLAEKAYLGGIGSTGPSSIIVTKLTTSWANITRSIVGAQS